MSSKARPVRPGPSQVIGLDIGTTSTIGIRLDTVTGERRIASRPVTLSSPHPGWAEEDPEEWWANCVSVLRELSDGVDIAGVGVAGMVPATVLLDRAGRLLRPSIQQSDGRVAAQVAEIAAEIDAAEFLARTGNGVNQQLVATKLRWIERHEPAVFAAIGTVFGSYDYINFRLTGARNIEQNWALEGGFVDLADGLVAADLVALAHLSPDQLPPLAASLKSWAGLRPPKRGWRSARRSSRGARTTSPPRSSPGSWPTVICS